MDRRQVALCLMPIPQHSTKKFGTFFRNRLIFLKKQHAFNHSVCMKSQVVVLKITNLQNSSVTVFLAHGLDFSC